MSISYLPNSSILLIFLDSDSPHLPSSSSRYTYPPGEQSWRKCAILSVSLRRTTWAQTPCLLFRSSPPLSPGGAGRSPSRSARPEFMLVVLPPLLESSSLQQHLYLSLPSQCGGCSPYYTSQVTFSPSSHGEAVSGC